MMEAVHRYEGTVNQVMGDGIMALFGAPLAHEDHAVRACYAALRMQEAMRRYADEVRRAHGVPVQIRVGLNSGEVVVRAIGNDLHMDYSAVGQTTHLRRAWSSWPAGHHPAHRARPCGWPKATSRSALGPVRSRGSPTRRGLRADRGRAGALAPAGRRGPRAHPLRRARGRARQLAAGPGARRRRPRPGRRRGRRAGVGKSRLVYEFIHVPPHPGLAGAGERLGVLRQGDALFPGHRPAQALLPDRGRTTTRAPCATR